MSLSLSDVTHIAQLARIELSAAEASATLSQLNEIFALIEKMQAVATEGVVPLATPLAAIDEVALRMREDKVTESDQRPCFQGQAPAIQDGLYLVPRVIE